MTVSCCISCDGLPLITTTPPEINVDFVYITTYSNNPLRRVLEVMSLRCLTHFKQTFNIA
jgi:hypothetical protein